MNNVTGTWPDVDYTSGCDARYNTKHDLNRFKMKTLCISKNSKLASPFTLIQDR